MRSWPAWLPIGSGAASRSGPANSREAATLTSSQNRRGVRGPARPAWRSAAVSRNSSAPAAAPTTRARRRRVLLARAAGAVSAAGIGHLGLDRRRCRVLEVVEVALGQRHALPARGLAPWHAHGLGRERLAAIGADEHGLQLG